MLAGRSEQVIAMLVPNILCDICHGSNIIIFLVADLPPQEQQCQVDLRGATPAELRKELASRVRARMTMQIMAGADADPVRLSLPGYRARWYEQRFGASAGEWTWQ